MPDPFRDVYGLVDRVVNGRLKTICIRPLAIQQQRDARDMASERWQESDRANSHEYWLDELDDYRTSYLDAEGGDVPKIEE